MTSPNTLPTAPSLTIAPFGHRSGGKVTGTDGPDTIDLAALFPDALYGSVADGGAGDDMVHGTALKDDFYASAGDDTLIGGDGRDNLYFILPEGLTGKLSGRNNGPGSMALDLDGRTLLTATLRADGTILVTGEPGTVAEQFGTETVSGIENLMVRVAGTTGGTGAYSLDLSSLRLPEPDNSTWTADGLKIWYGKQGGTPQVEGTAQADTVDLLTLFPVMDGSDGNTIYGASLNAAEGDDRMLGTARGDIFIASPGADTIDGRGASDTLLVDLPRGNGTVTQRSDGAGRLLIELEGRTILTVERDGNATVVRGMDGTIGAGVGTETLTNVEKIWVLRRADSGPSVNFTIPLDSMVTPVTRLEGTGVTVTGTPLNDSIDLAALVTKIAESRPNVPLSGGTANPGAGNDKVLGTAQSDNVRASAGDDTIDGGAGSDVIVFAFPRDSVKSFSTGVDGNGNKVIQADGTAVLKVVKQAENAYTITGITGTIGAEFGVETVTNVETLLLSTLTSSGLQDIHGPSHSLQLMPSARPAGTTGTPLPSVAPAVKPLPDTSTQTGTSRNDLFLATVGDDSIDGGAGQDMLVVSLFGKPYGKLTLSDLVDGRYTVSAAGTALFDIARGQNGTVVLTSLGDMAATYGLETLTSIEEINFVGSGGVLNVPLTGL